MACLRTTGGFGDNLASTPNAGPSARWRRDLLAIAVLLLGVWALHGHGLTLGFWFDDHNHLELCRKNGFSDLAGGNRFDWTGRLTHVWWAQQETGWAYFRPLAVAIRVSLLDLFGLNPLPFHVIHLTLFSLSVVLFYGLLRRCGWAPGAAWTAGLFLVLHPANSFTTPWLANDGPVLVGLWLLTGLWLMHASGQVGHRRFVLLAGVFLCYALALLSRENGLMVGPLLVLFDFLSAKRQPAPGQAGPAIPQATWRRRLALYAGLAVVGVIYLPLRSWCLGPGPAPRSPYFHWPTEPGFIAWLPFKILNDLVCLPLGLPFVPIVDVPWWQAHPLTTAAGVAVLLLLAAVVLWPLRRSRILWGVLAGTLLAQAPTLLVFSAPYNYYLATAGWAVLLTMGLRRWWATRPRLVIGVAGVLATWYLIGLWAGAWMMHSAARAEQLVRADVLATQPAAYPKGTRLFFINLPFFAAEVGPALRNAVDRPDLEIYPLTYAQEPFFPTSDAVVEQEDAHTLLVHSSGKGFFSGAFGDQVQLSWYGAHRGDVHTGPMDVRPAAGPMPFRVEVVEADGQGVKALRFVFDCSLDDPGYRFFLGSPRALAQELCFRHGETDSAPAALGVYGSRSEAMPQSEPSSIDPLVNQEMERLRRMQLNCNHVMNLLANWPF